MQSDLLLVDEAVRVSMIQAEIANTTGQAILRDTLLKQAENLRNADTEYSVAKLKIKTITRSI